MIYHSPQNVSLRYDCSVQKVHQLIALGRLRAINTSTGKRPIYRIPEASIQEFENANRIMPSISTPGGVSGPSVPVQ